MKNKQSSYGEDLQVPGKSMNMMNEHCDWYSIWKEAVNFVSPPGVEGNADSLNTQPQTIPSLNNCLLEASRAPHVWILVTHPRQQSICLLFSCQK